MNRHRIKSLLLVSGLGLLLTGILVTVYLAQQQQNIRSQAAATPKLRWSPPTLTNPTTIQLGTGETETKLDTNKDYIIKFPTSRKNGRTVLSGGRNIVIIGGHASTAKSLPNCNNPCTTVKNRVLQINDATGTVHIEGVLFDATGGYPESDAITIGAPKATVQLQNIRMQGFHGTYDHWHADLIQPWGGVKEIRIDRMTGGSNYQAFYLVYNTGPVTIQNTNLIREPNGEGRLIWQDGGSCNSRHPSLLTYSNVYIQSSNVGREVYPGTDKPSSCLARISNGVITWPNQSWVKGSINTGLPAGGDFVPAGLAGLSYVSPGYTDGTEAPTANPTTATTNTPTPLPLTVTPTRVPSITTSPTSTTGPTTAVPTNQIDPTATPDPDSTNISLTLLLQGLGKGGDSVNPNSLGNPAPVHPQKSVQVEVYDTANKKVYEGAGVLTYNSAEGNFTGTAAVGTITSGSYTIKVTVNGFLTKNIPGFHRLTNQTINSLPQATLITGDVIRDNKLNILDYSALSICASNGESVGICGDESGKSADLNDDGYADLIDYNLFIRNISVSGGQ